MEDGEKIKGGEKKRDGRIFGRRNTESGKETLGKRKKQENLL